MSGVVSWKRVRAPWARCWSHSLRRSGPSELECTLLLLVGHGAGGGGGGGLDAAALGLEAQGVVLLAELRHGEDVRAPEVVGLGPADGAEDGVACAAVLVDQEAGCVAPVLGDGRAAAAVGFDEVGEEGACLLDVGADLGDRRAGMHPRSEEHTSELQSRGLIS